MILTPETIEANQRGLAAAIQSIAFANALTIAAMGSLLDREGVIPVEKFSEMMLLLADMVEASGPRDDDGIAAEMLRKVHAIIREQNPPKWKPTVVDGGA